VLVSDLFAVVGVVILVVAEVGVLGVEAVVGSAASLVIRVSDSVVAGMSEKLGDLVEGALETGGVLPTGAVADAVALGAVRGGASIGVFREAADVAAASLFKVAVYGLDDLNPILLDALVKDALGVSAEFVTMLFGRADLLGALEAIALAKREASFTFALPDVAVVLSRTGTNPTDVA